MKSICNRLWDHRAKRGHFYEEELEEVALKLTVKEAAGDGEGDRRLMVGVLAVVWHREGTVGQHQHHRLWSQP